MVNVISPKGLYSGSRYVLLHSRQKKIGGQTSKKKIQKFSTTGVIGVSEFVKINDTT
ncbi:hypothetical protein OTSTA716_2103 [Orientia tsutsugamushi str. TA716]|uniref:Uncharacterized protein n=1 Tax=Orientia tsutsugamushi str. TA716 TaxID=1359175 RepID=A0A0F3NV68_ORITS|nr:hypothetical protein OTSTA716_2103 [Orientia tsutsugamushi str. TA716]